MEVYDCWTVAQQGIGWIVVYVVSGPILAVIEGRVSELLRYQCCNSISTYCLWQLFKSLALIYVRGLIVCCTFAAFTASKKLSQYALSSGSRKSWICCEKTIVCHNLFPTCRIMQKQMGWNTYVHIVALQISRRNRRKLEMDFPQGWW